MLGDPDSAKMVVRPDVNNLNTSRIPSGRCETCVYFHPATRQYGGEGDCRKNPPVISTFGTSAVNDLGDRWARVAKSDWCGNYVDKPDLTQDSRVRQART
ncbi:MAG: hypothetical protein HQK59_04070 [Deltaproteobacteria bacterium]|nr:hypothetical protein [Deltaproteobacteria bacterium]